jgi:hypothetical protein
MKIHGAKWWKFDFHTHTPISTDYGKGPNHSILQERKPREWLLDCMLKGIDCVAVTDHNSGDWIDTLKAELNSMREEGVEGFRELVIFPGVEITVHGGIHLLAIFDPSETSRHISNLLSRCGYSGSYGDSDDCTTKSFNEVVDIIHEMKGIAIPAHVDDVKGLFKEEEGVPLKKCLTANGLLAIEIKDSAFVKPQLYSDLKLSFAEVVGSDSHHPESLGSRFTWVKMEVPNLEALRLALHDGEDGIIRFDKTADDPNDVHKRFYIQSIEIRDGAKAGRGTPLKVEFSPWLNTIIGGRGSGKSSLIEYMRLPLDKVTGLPKKIDEEFKEFCQVPKERGKPGMLTNKTTIRVEMQKEGRTVALTWQDQKIIEEQKNENGEWEQKEASSNIDARFPIRIFSQKHLYSLTEDPNHILNVIDQQLEKATWLEKRKELSKKWMQSKAKERDIASKINSKGNLMSELDDVRAKMKIFEESGHKTLLEEFQKTQNINGKLTSELSKIESFHNNIKMMLEEAPQTIFDEKDFAMIDSESLKKLKYQANEFEIIRKKIEEVLVSLEKFNVQVQQIVEEIPWQHERKICERKYNEFVQKLEEKGEKNPNAYSQLVVKQAELEQKLTDIKPLEEQLKIQKDESNKISEEIEQHEKWLRNRRADIITQWQRSNPNIRIYLKVMGDIDSAETSFRTIIRKTGGEFAKDILERDEGALPKNGFILDLAESSDPWNKRKEIINRIISVDERNSNHFGKYLVNHIIGLKKSTPEDIDRLIDWYPEDKIILKLVNASGKEEDIETGSAGQRTAAMLSLMLTLDDSPIIIDQPEEDLDTKRITDLVVTGLRHFKTKQQVIVITHNPNIPVNGAAENIIQMYFARGQIWKQISGALQKNDVREAVCEVMEGGREALNKRYFRISKALGS